MTQNQSTHSNQSKKRRKWPWITLAVILLLIGFVKYAVQADWFFNQIRQYVERTASESLHGDLQIEHMSGDLFSHVDIRGIKLQDAEQSGIAVIDSIKVEYSFLELVRSPNTLDRIDVYQLKADVVEDEEGWNVLNILPETEEPEKVEEEEDITEALPELVIRNIELHNHEITVSSPTLPDERAVIGDLNLEANISVSPQHQNVQLTNLDFQITEGRLDGPLELVTSARVDDEVITLESLTVTGAHTFLETHGDFDQQTEEFDFQLLLDPLGYGDVTPYADEWPIVQDVTVEVSTSGSLSDFNAGISLSAPGLDQLEINAGLATGSPLALTSLSVNTGAIDPTVLMEEELPQIEEFQLALQGNVPVDDWQNGRLNGDLSVSGLNFDPYSLDSYTADIDWDAGSATLDQLLTLDGEQITANLTLNDLFESQHWNADIFLNEINPAVWAQDDQLEGLVNGSIMADGAGFELTDEFINFEMDFDQLEMMKESIEHFHLAGSVNETHIEADNRIDLLRGSIVSEIESEWNREPIRYSLSTEASDLDLASFSFVQEISSDLNFTFEGQGSGVDLEELDMEGVLSLSESYFNEQEIESITTSFSIADEIIHIDESLIESEIAGGSLSARFNITDYTDIDNRLDFDLELRDLQSFASLAGADSLSARGNLTGYIQPTDNQLLEFNSNLALTNVAYDTLYIDKINGNARSELTTTPEYYADLDILHPRLGEFSARDIRIETEGNVEDDVIAGSNRFEFNISDESGLVQQSDYHIAPEDIRFTTHVFNIFDPNIEYYLTEPFDFRSNEAGVALDTMRLAADDGSSIALSGAQDEAGTITGYVSGADADLSVVQSAVLDEVVFEALLSGDTRFRFSEEELEVYSNINVSRFNYQELRFDLLNLDLDISDQRMVTDLQIQKDEQNLLESHFNLPFEPVAPEDLDETFFEEHVEGYLNIDPADIAMFDDFLEEIGIGAQTGTLSASTELSGTAGSPNFYGDVLFYDGKLSGVEVDTVRVNWDYVHADEEIMVNSYVESLGQRAAEIEGKFPFYADFQTFQVDVPEDEDEIEFNLNTTDFRLAAFNDFLDPNTLRNLQGLLNANIDITGSVAEPYFEGDLNLTGGLIRLIPNNIRVREIRLDLGLEPDKLTINTFRARSEGTMSGSGEITLDGFALESFDVQLNASNFLAFDDQDIRAVISLNTLLNGNMEEPELTGTFQLNRGRFNLDNFGERAVEDVELEDEEPRIPADEIDFFQRLAMDMQITMGRNVFLRNRRDPELDLTLRGELSLVKEHMQELEVFGELNIPTGHATTMLNKRFDIDSGSIMFSGDPQNPELDIRTQHRPRQQDEDIRIWYVITGTVNDPEFNYESEPEMEFQDIISYTLFGRPFESLGGWERTVTSRGESNIAADIALDVLIDRVEALAADRLGIDVFQIDNSRTGSGSGTSIKAGKFLTDRVFVAYVQELGGTTAGRQVIVEYMIRSNLELMFTGSDDYRSGIDLLWRYDY